MSVPVRSTSFTTVEPSGAGTTSVVTAIAFTLSIRIISISAYLRRLVIISILLCRIGMAAVFHGGNFRVAGVEGFAGEPQLLGNRGGSRRCIGFHGAHQRVFGPEPARLYSSRV